MTSRSFARPTRDDCPLGHGARSSLINISCRTDPDRDAKSTAGLSTGGIDNTLSIGISQVSSEQISVTFTLMPSRSDESACSVSGLTPAAFHWSCV